MATQAQLAPDDGLAVQARVTAVMALVIAGCFTLFLARGSSSFSAPWHVHVHAVLFFGWVVLSGLQAALAAGGDRSWHRRLGWLGALWIAAMLPAGLVVTIRMVQAGHVPPDFQPQHFLLQDPATLLTFVGLAGAAIARRKSIGWHRRLHLCALASLMGPAFGRALPAELLILPFSFEIAAIPGLLFPAFLAWREWRASGRVHPAWMPGIGALPVALLICWFLAESTLGAALYAATVIGTPGEAVPGLAFPPGA
ncbi:MAG: hypothetical protein ACOYO0_05850 [Sandarakinorhabdus sp.]